MNTIIKEHIMDYFGYDEERAQEVIDEGSYKELCEDEAELKEFLEFARGNS